MSRPHRRARHTFAQRNILALALVKAQAEAMLQNLFRFVHQQHAEAIVVDQTSHTAGDLFQQCIEVENRREFLS